MAAPTSVAHLPALLPTAPPPHSTGSTETDEWTTDPLFPINAHQPGPPLALPPPPPPHIMTAADQQQPRPFSYPVGSAFPHPSAFPMSSGNMQPPPLAPLDHGMGHGLAQTPWGDAFPLPPPPFPHPGPPFAHHPTMDAFNGPPTALGFFPGAPSHLPPPPPVTPNGQVLPRPHPYLVHPVLYLSHVPTDIRDNDIVEVLKRQGIPTGSVGIPDAVQPVERLWPDAYYTWMTKNGCVEFNSAYDAEKALSLLVRHPYLVGNRNVLVSPFSPPNSHPLPPAPVAPRLIRPVKFVDPAGRGGVPTEGQVYDCVRPWGSIREVSVILEVSQPDASGPPSEMRWRARVEFWYEDEAQRFEAGFANSQVLMGWQVDIRRDPSYITMAPLPFQQPLMPLGSPVMSPAPFNSHFGSPVMGHGMPPLGTPFEHPAGLPPRPHFGQVHQLPHRPPAQAQSPSPLPGPTSATPVPQQAAGTPLDGDAATGPPSQMGSPATTSSQQLANATYVPHPGSFAPGSGQTLPATGGTVNMVPPPSPPQPGVQRFTAPWAMHNRAATLPVSPPWAVSERLPGDGGNNGGPFGSKPRRNSKSSRRWKEVPGGIVSEDGTVIQHGPGQQIQPAPKMGPGSSSSSGLVDYCNLIVKNLDPDIAGPYLLSVFAPYGHVINARIMRDGYGRSRGFGFVSFLEPTEAARALAQMNGVALGNGLLSVSYHEPLFPPPRVIGNAQVKNGRGRGRGRGQAPNQSGPMNRRHPDSHGPSAQVLPAKPEHTVKPDDESKSEPALPEMERTASSTAESSSESESVATPVDKARYDSVERLVYTPPHQRVRSLAPSPSSRADRPLPKIDEDVTSALFDAMSLDDLTLTTLAAMPPNKVLDHLARGGDHLLDKLSLAKPPGWHQFNQPSKTELIRRVGKMVVAPSLGPKSRLLSCIRDYVNSLDTEDEAAFAELLQYPALVSAMVLAAPSRFSRSDGALSV